MDSTAKELLEAVYESPGEDEPRLVFADHLMDVGDPWGKFIALQINRPDDVKPSGSERALERKHHRRWLGKLDAAIASDGCEFRRGFLDRCAMATLEEDHDFTGYAEWSTVRHIHLARQKKNLKIPSLLTSSAMRSLCVVTGLAERDLEVLRDEHESLPWTGLGFDKHYRAGDLAFLERHPFRCVERLDLSQSSMRQIEEVLASRLGHQLKVLRVQETRRGWTELIARCADLERLDRLELLPLRDHHPLRPTGWLFALERDASGVLSRFSGEHAMWMSSYSSSELTDFLSALPVGTLSAAHIRFLARNRDDATAYTTSLRRAVNQAGVTEIDIVVD